MKYLLMLVGLLFAFPVFAADGDKLSTGSQGTQLFILCDGTVSSTDRTCPEFDIRAKVGPIRQFNITIETSTGGTCATNGVGTINVGNVSGGSIHTLDAVNATDTTLWFEAASYRFLSIVTTGATAAGCTNFTIHGAFVPAELNP